MPDDFMDFMLSGGAELFPELMGNETYECPHCGSSISYYEKVEVISKDSFRCPSCKQEVTVDKT